VEITDHIILKKKRFHNHNNNQTKPKKQPNTKNKPTTNLVKIHTHKKTYNNNQQKHRKQKVSKPKTGCCFFCKFNGLFFCWTDSLNNYFSINHTLAAFA
jgi:hypothetical protein